MENIKPIYLTEITVTKTEAAPVVKENILYTSVGLTAGYLSKLLFERLSKGPLTKIISTALMFGVTNVIVKNPEFIKSMGKIIFNIIGVNRRKNK